MEVAIFVYAGNVSGQIVSEFSNVYAFPIRIINELYQLLGFQSKPRHSCAYAARL